MHVKIIWRTVLILTLTTTGLQVLLAILSRAAGGLFTPGTTEDGATMLAMWSFQIFFIFCMPVVDLLGGLLYAAFHRQSLPLTIAEGALGGGIIGCLSRVVSTVFSIIVDIFLVLITPPESLLGAGPETSTMEVLVLTGLIGGVLSLVTLSLLGIFLGGLGGAAAAAVIRLSSSRNRKAPAPRGRPGDSPAPPQEEPRRLLNPFNFPSETKLRTVLLIVAVAALNWIYGTVLMFFFLVGPNGFAPIEAIRSPVIDLLEIFSGEPSDSLAVNPWRREQLIHEHIAAIRDDPAARRKAREELVRLGIIHLSDLGKAWPYVVLPSLFSLSLMAAWALLYLTHTVRLRWLTGAKDLPPGDHGPLQETMRNLVTDVRTRQRDIGKPEPRHPKLKVTRGIRGEAQVYGFPGRYAIAVSRSLSAVLRKDFATKGRPHRIRALVLHELAHIVNRDVGLAYWAEAAWFIILSMTLTLVVLLPWSVGNEPLHALWFMIWPQMLITLLIIELNRRSLLRNREYYADSRAALFWNAEEPLLDVLDQQPPTRLRWWNSAWSKHPGTSERRKRVRSSDLLLRVSDGLALQAGILFSYVLFASLVFVSFLQKFVHAFVSLVVIHGTLGLMEPLGADQAFKLYHRLSMLPQMTLMILVGIAGFLLSTYLLSGTVGVQIQHESLVQVFNKRRGWRSYVELLRPAFLVAAGIEIGLLLMPFMPFLPRQPKGVVAIVVWLVLATFPIWLWMAATRFCARRIFGSHCGNKPPNGKRRWLTLVSTIPLSLALASALAGQMWFWPQPPAGTLNYSWSPLALSVISFFLFVCALIVMLFVLGAGHALQRTTNKHCSACGEHTTRRWIVTELCQHCGRSLAPWVFAPRES